MELELTTVATLAWAPSCARGQNNYLLAVNNYLLAVNDCGIKNADTGVSFLAPSCARGAAGL